MAYGYLYSLFGKDICIFQKYLDTIEDEELLIMTQQMDKHINAPLTSSCARLFDAVSALLGIRQQVTYEGQAAIELENLADPACEQAYHFTLQDGQIGWKPVLEEILSDLRHGRETPQISAKFHNALIHVCLEICDRIQQKHHDRRFAVALSGGVWQNQRLLNGVRKTLRENGWEVLLPRQLPFNDGCIAFGQAVIADAVIRNSETLPN